MTSWGHGQCTSGWTRVDARWGAAQQKQFQKKKASSHHHAFCKVTGDASGAGLGNGGSPHALLLPTSSDNEKEKCSCCPMVVIIGRDNGNMYRWEVQAVFNAMPTTMQVGFGYLRNGRKSRTFLL